MNGEERRQVGTGGSYVGAQVRHSEYRATLETSYPPPLLLPPYFV